MNDPLIRLLDRLGADRLSDNTTLAILAAICAAITLLGFS